MAMKVDFLYPFDKGFFGKTLLAGAQDNAVQKSSLKKVMPDSIRIGVVKNDSIKD